MNRISIMLSLTTALCLGFARDAAAQAPDLGSGGGTCDTAKPLDGQRLLRRLSLDLRGVVPTYEEALAQKGKPDVDESIIDAYLASPDFTRMMRSYHSSLLWPNIDQVEIVPQQNQLYAYEITPGNPIYMSPLRAVFMRAAMGGNLYLPCKDEPARFDSQGHVIAEPLMMGGSIVGYQEGWVELKPYWDTNTTIKVCGFDAQSAPRATMCPGPAERYPFIDPVCDQLQQYADATGTPFRNTETACDGPLAFFAPGCGCGPNLIYCHTADTLKTLQTSLLEQEMRIVDDVITNDKPYQDILTTKDVEVNGPIAVYLANQSRLGFDLYGEHDQTSPVPDGLTFADVDTWVKVTRTGRHAGILTTPGYLLRFQSNRGRAHRFYNAFECSSFIPAGPLPSPFEMCSKHEDLTKRCGCDACHRALEPMASHWGRFAEYGISPIDDRDFPARIGPKCMQPFDSMERLLRCFRFYKLQPVGEEMAFYGMLNSYVFRTPGEVAADIEQGPLHLAGESISSGRFSTCTARKMWTQFMRRAPTPDEETEVLPDLQRKFDDAGSSLRALVKAIVTSPAYRRMP